MSQQTKQTQTINTSPEEERDINQRIYFELNEIQLKMIKVGGVTNLLTGLFVIWFLYGQVPWHLLISWYVALAGINIINIIFSFCYQFCKVTHEKIKPWLWSYHFILAIICLVWGSMPLLTVDSSIVYQFYAVTFLQVVLFGFSFGTMTDFTATVISITGLLFPYLGFQTYRYTRALHSMPDGKLDFGFSLGLVILGFFLLITCYIGYQLVKRSFKLSFTNSLLNQKLENINIFLEQRVKERTTELEHSLKLLTYQATHDLLTDLPNQRLLMEYMEASIKAATQSKHMFAVIFFSINEIQKINDALSFQTGDAVIRTVAQRFRSIFSMESFHNVRYKVSLSRKDTFIILLDPIFRLEEVERSAEALFQVIEEPIHIEKQELKLTGSIGVSVYPRDGRDEKKLFMNADAAMLHARQQGGNSIYIYNNEINADVSQRLEMDKNLHNALANNEFLLQFQPVVDLHTGEIAAAEALVRWNNKELGYVPPDIFIPIAEENGVIIPLGEWVFETACKQLKRWHNMGYNNLRVAINVSAKQLKRKNIVQTFADILTQTNLQASYIELELTESIAFLDDVVPVLKQFKEMGLCLSIDDFGTGYSGLSNIKLFNINTLKIDKSFVQDIDTNNDSRAIVSNTITLAKKINVKVIAEGVETKEQLKFLKEYNCDMIQGYYFSPPVTMDSFTKLLESKEPFVI
jgi:diguanylate cyclase (GGDEF)-like protein